MEEVDESSDDESIIYDFDFLNKNIEELDIEKLFQSVKSLNLKLIELKYENERNLLISEDEEEIVDANKEANNQIIVEKYAKKLVKENVSISTNGVPSSLMFEVKYSK